MSSSSAINSIDNKPTELKFEEIENADDNSNNKRAKVESDDSYLKNRVRSGRVDEFVKGSICRIHVHNFVTYEDAQILPGPRLNVIVGPNGSGKSSIVCAIALGLAGNPTVLRRASKLHEFIRHGADSAWIEIELWDKGWGKNTIIRRSFSKDTGTSSYSVNGKSTTERAVRTMLTKLNIMVDNLCQFLPQDRVGDFTRMNACDLLRETEKAVQGDNAQLSEMHEQLIDLKGREKENTMVHKARRDKLEILIAKNADLKRDVLRFKARQEAEEQLKWLTRKMPWMKFETARRQALAEKDRLAGFQKKLEEVSARHAPMLQQISQLEENAKDAATALQDCKQSTKRKRDEFARLKRDLEALVEKTQGLRRDRTQIERRAQRHEQTVARLKRELEQVEDEMAALPSDSHNEKKLEEAKKAAADAEANGETAARDMAAANRTLRQHEPQLHALRQQKAQLADRRTRRLNAVGNMRNGRDTRRCEDWIRQHSAMFEHKVFGPIIAELDVSEQRYANCVEEAMPQHLMQAFVVQSQRDRATLLRELKGKMGVHLTIVHLPQRPQRTRVVSDDVKRRVGIDKWLDEVIQCDPVVMDALIANIKINTVAICADQCDVRQVENAGVSYFFHKQTIFTSNKSRYGNRERVVRTRTMHPRGARILTASGAGDIDELNQRIAQLESDLTEQRRIVTAAKQQQQESQALLKRVRDAEMACADARRKRNNMRDRVQRARDSYEEARNERVDTGEAEAARLDAKLEAVLAKRIALASSVPARLQAYVEAARQQDLAQLKRTHFGNQLNLTKNEQRKQSEELETAQTLVMASKMKYKELKNETRARRATAEQKCPITQEVREKFEQLPDDEALVEAGIRECRSRISNTVAANPGIVREFEEREREIEQLTEAVSHDERNIARHSALIEELRSAWEPKLVALAERLDASFSQHMAEIGCAGEVSLQPHPDDFAKYEMSIKVKFRDHAPLTQLSDSRQSGGERSVSTMLYLIALQDLTNCPFRLVDEINQGMDPSNERTIFKQVVSAATKPGLPQYFLLTPKVLPDLDYNRATSVLCVFNGAHHISQSEYDAEQFIKSAAAHRKRRRENRQAAGNSNGPR